MEVRLAADAGELDQAMQLLGEVFCAELGIELRPDRDGVADGALHVVAVEDARVLGTCRVLMDGELARLGRLVVEAGARRRGVATAILAAAERSAAGAGARVMRLQAQRYVEQLYSAAGYSRRGDPFVEQGIAHVTMEKPLA